MRYNEGDNNIYIEVLTYLPLDQVPSPGELGHVHTSLDAAWSKHQRRASPLHTSSANKAQYKLTLAYIETHPKPDISFLN